MRRFPERQAQFPLRTVTGSCYRQAVTGGYPLSSSLFPVTRFPSRTSAVSVTNVTPTRSNPQQLPTFYDIDRALVNRDHVHESRRTTARPVCQQTPGPCCLASKPMIMQRRPPSAVKNFQNSRQALQPANHLSAFFLSLSSWLGSFEWFWSHRILFQPKQTTFLWEGHGAQQPNPAQRADFCPYGRSRTGYPALDVSQSTLLWSLIWLLL